MTETKLVRLFAAAAMTLTLAGCSLQIYETSMEMRRPSASGLDLTGKDVAIVYPYGLTQDEMKLTGSLAQALADKLDGAYPESDSTKIFSIEYTDSFKNMASVDSLETLVLRTEADVVFLLGHPSEFESGYRQGEFRLPIYCYDALAGSRAAVKEFTVRADAGADAVTSGKIIGNKISRSFVPTWEAEDFQIWYSSDPEWNSALRSALSFDWAAAMKTWLEILDKTPQRDSYLRSCLEYNIGLSCYMSGNKELALQWLNQSKAENPYEDLTDELIELISRNAN